MQTKLAVAQPIETHPRYGETPERFPEGRRCSTCRKELSVYNGSKRCFACIKARDEEFVFGTVSFAELLEEAP